MRISDWSSDVCSSDLVDRRGCANAAVAGERYARHVTEQINDCGALPSGDFVLRDDGDGLADLRERLFSARRGNDDLVPLGCLRQSRSEEHTSELQSLMRISYAVFCLKKTTRLC